MKKHTSWLRLLTPNIDSIRRATDAYTLETFSHSRVVVFAFFVSAITTLCQQSYYYGVSDHVSFLPLMFRALDPSWLFGDVFVDRLATEIGPYSYSAPFLAHIASPKYWPILFLFLTILGNASVVLISFYAGMMLFDGSKRAGFGAAILTQVAMGTDLGGLGTLHYPMLLFSQYAMIFSLLALWALWCRRMLLSGVACAIAISIHPGVGIVVGITIFTAQCIIIADEFFSDTYLWARWVKRCGAAIVGGTIFFITTLALWPIKEANTSAEDLSILSKMIFVRAQHHFMPSTWPLVEWIGGAMLLLGIALLLHRLKGMKGISNSSIVTRYIGYFILVCMLFFFCGWFFVEIYPNAFWIKLQPYRLTAYINWVAMLLAGGILTTITTKTTLGWGVALLSGPAFPYAFGGVAFANWLSEGRNRKGLSLLAWAGLLLAVSGAVIMVSLSMMTFLRQAYWSFFIAVGGYLICTAHRWNHYLLVVLSLGLFLCADQISLRLVSKTPLKSIMSSPIVWSDDAMNYTVFRGAHSFISDNIPVNALFVIPPEDELFRIAARRKIIVDAKCFVPSTAGIKDWLERMDICYGPLPDNRNFMAYVENYYKISDMRLAELALRYGATHALLHAQTATTLPVIYQDDAGKVVELRGKRNVSMAHIHSYVSESRF